MTDAVANEPRQGVSPVIAIHAGAGAITPKLRDHGEQCRGALDEVLAAARRLLEDGAEALTVVRTAVAMMEDFELFNSGRGSALCADGTAQMSASMMRGSDRAAGAVAGIQRVRNPIIAAHAVLESPQVLLIGEHADRYGIAHGAEEQPNGYFVTERQQRNLSLMLEESPGTVGAVCRDSSGLLAAATSTGGVLGQPPGRVGDSPVLGAGTWADEHAAVSCTGDGEMFIRSGVARTIAWMAGKGVTLAEATEHALADVALLGGTGGLVACDAAGNLALPFSTAAMPRGIWRAGGEPRVWITEPGP